MTAYSYHEVDPDKGYVSNNLLLPKAHVNNAVIKAALTFQLDEEEVIVDECGQAIGTRPALLKLWDETAHHLVVPREFIRAEQREEFPCEFVELPRPHFERVDIPDRILLRNEDQEESFDALLLNDSGTLNLACGQGKTVLALKLAATLQVPTMIVVNSTYLLEQWKDEIFEHLGIRDVGILQGESRDWDKGIVVAMVHTLSGRRGEWPMEMRQRFGLVIYDEGHHMSAPMFSRSADLFFGRRFSLTATAERTDGLEAIYQYHLGRVIHSNLKQELIPHTVFHILNWDMPPNHRPMVEDRNREICTPRVRTYLGSLDWRNDLIYEQLLEDLREGRKILVLSHSVDHVDRLYSYLSAAGAGMIVGETDQGTRPTILLNSNPVFGTFQLAREGLNKPSLDTLYVTTLFSNKNDLQQAWGRIQRLYEGKLPPLVRVFEDPWFSYCRKAGNSLRRFLRDLNYPYERVNHDIEIAA